MNSIFRNLFLVIERIRAFHLAHKMDKSDILAVKFSGKNYLTWEFKFKLQVKRKDLWGHIDGSTKKPTDKMEHAKWETHGAQIMSQILNSVEPHIVLNLRP